ncbi:MAG: hypothetical protein AAFR12_04235 [Cyanobacteria bacterium J06626_6]
MTSIPPSPSSGRRLLGQRIRNRLSGFIWPLVWTAILATVGGVSLRAVTVMTQNPPLPDCGQLASGLGSDSERLLCAQASVQSGSAQALIEAIELVEPWRPNHPQYEEANRLMNRWSQALLVELENMAQQGQMRRALALAERIPDRVAIYPQVKSAIATWEKEWTVGKDIEKEVAKAIKARDWVAARRDLQRLKILNSNYWVRTRHDQLRAKIDREQTARVRLDKARELVETGDLEKLGEALALTKGINLETSAWSESKAEINQWAEQVLQYSFKKWEEEDIEAAIAVVQLVPPDMANTAEAKDLISFGHAKRLANDPYDQWAPSYGQIYNLLEAIQAVQRISPDSPFHIEAQDSLTKWQKKLDDMVQLQYASTLANVGQDVTYRWAIAEAEQITQERPQRLQAQTLVSHWKKEIERLEDRPILTEAVRLATAGGKRNLQAAIAQAAKVEQGRALRVEGQTYIAEWADRIEIIEDQPILKKAQALADAGELSEAIAEAKKVQTGRALYAEAQTAVEDWTEELQIIEDRPILIEAQNLAAIGSLSAAIDVAAQIAPGRALYGEARASIAIWDEERAYIWSLDAPAQSDGFNDDSFTERAPYDDGYYDDGYYDDGYSSGEYYGEDYYDDGF